MSADIEFVNLQDFIGRMRAVANEYPKTAEKHLRRLGNKLKTAVRKATPSGKTAEYYQSKSGKRKRSKKKLKNSWTGKIFGNRGQDLEYGLWSKSKRYHLVERGHALVMFGHSTGRYVQGKFFFRRAVDDFKSSDKTQKQLEAFFHEIKAKAEGGHA